MFGVQSSLGLYVFTKFPRDSDTHQCLRTTALVSDFPPGDIAGCHNKGRVAQLHYWHLMVLIVPGGTRQPPTQPSLKYLECTS